MKFEHPLVKPAQKKGIEPCLETGEVLQYFSQGTTKRVVGLQLLGIVGYAVGWIGALVAGAAETASIYNNRSKEFIIALTDKRVLLIQFELPYNKPGEVIFIAFNELKSVEYSRGFASSKLTFTLSGKELSFVFEKTPWITRALELGRMIESRIRFL